jgi:CheY-like chemotaxis protein
VIAVADTGVGMPEDVRGRAFEPFFSTKSEGRGSGLGLSMVYGFARQSGGQVVIESAVGRGATIRIYLPRAAGGAPQPEADAPEHVAAASPSRVLVLDDDAVVRGVTAQMVRDLGHDVVEAETGAAALELLSKGARFDAMVVDLAMPNMHGAVFAVRARQITPDTPVLFVTGYADAAWTSDVSADDLLKKPFNSSMIADKLGAMLRAADSTGPAAPQATD